MNARERFLRTCKFDNVPPPRWECLGFWASTVERWRTEGLPNDVDPWDYFEMDRWERLPIDSGFTHNPYFPPFEHKVFQEDERTVTFVDGQGIVKRNRKDNPEMSMSQFLKFPVADRRDWEELKWRLDPQSPERYPDWQETRRQWENRNNPLGLFITGGYGFPRNLFGEEQLAYMFYDDAPLMHEIMAHWMEFYKGICDIALPEIEVDYIYLWEDMAFKNGPLISPAMFREFVLPYYREVIACIRSHGVENIIVDSDGDNRPILDLFLEAGVNVFFPLEIAAGMEPLEVRAKYGRQFVLWGGVDKRALSKDRAAIDRELDRKIPQMLESRGFIPAVDHSVPPDVPFENYAYYVKRVREMTAQMVDG